MKKTSEIEDSRAKRILEAIYNIDLRSRSATIILSISSHESKKNLINAIPDCDVELLFFRKFRTYTLWDLVPRPWIFCLLIHDAKLIGQILKQSDYFLMFQISIIKNSEIENVKSKLSKSKDLFKVNDIEACDDYFIYGVDYDGVDSEVGITEFVSYRTVPDELKLYFPD